MCRKLASKWFSEEHVYTVKMRPILHWFQVKLHTGFRLCWECKCMYWNYNICSSVERAVHGISIRETNAQDFPV